MNRSDEVAEAAFQNAADNVLEMLWDRIEVRTE